MPLPESHVMPVDVRLEFLANGDYRWEGVAHIVRTYEFTDACVGTLLEATPSPAACAALEGTFESQGCTFDGDACVCTRAGDEFIRAAGSYSASDGYLFLRNEFGLELLPAEAYCVQGSAATIWNHGPMGEMDVVRIE